MRIAAVMCLIFLVVLGACKSTVDATSAGRQIPGVSKPPVFGSVVSSSMPLAADVDTAALRVFLEKFPVANRDKIRRLFLEDGTAKSVHFVGSPDMQAAFEKVRPPRSTRQRIP